MIEQKLVILTKKDIDSLKSIFENSEIISDEDKKALNLKREKARKNNLVMGDLFLYCFDVLSDYSHLFESEDKNFEKNIKGYLTDFSKIVGELRELIESYEEGEIGSYFDGERIRDYVRPNREKMSGLVNIFFSIISGEGSSLGGGF